MLWTMNADAIGLCAVRTAIKCNKRYSVFFSGVIITSLSIFFLLANITETEENVYDRLPHNYWFLKKTEEER